MNVIWNDGAAINREAVLVRHTDPVCDKRLSQRGAEDSHASSCGKNHMMMQLETCVRSGKREWPVRTKAKDWHQRALRIPVMFRLIIDVSLTAPIRMRPMLRARYPRPQIGASSPSSDTVARAEFALMV